jgi:hypothetical protein
MHLLFLLSRYFSLDYLILMLDLKYIQLNYRKNEVMRFWMTNFKYGYFYWIIYELLFGWFKDEWT